MKQAYSSPQVVEYGAAEQLTLGGGNTSLDISVSFNPLNPNDNSSIGVSSGSGCATINGVNYCPCS